MEQFVESLMPFRAPNSDSWQLLVYTGLAECLRDYHLTPMQYMLLSLSRRGGEMSSAELARRFAVTPQSMNEMIAMLQRKHLILRKTATEHRRILRISLTLEGARLLRSCDRQVDRMEKRLFADLASDEMRVFRNTLLKLIRCQPKNAYPVRNKFLGPAGEESVRA
jgi:DNA-binding MarR family transcriptional regulator